MPDAVDLLMQLAELRLVAAARGVTFIEVTDGKVKLTRNQELITVGGRFPVLTRRDPRARLAELRKLVMSVEETPGTAHSSPSK